MNSNDSPTDGEWYSHSETTGKSNATVPPSSNRNRGSPSSGTGVGGERLSSFLSLLPGFHKKDRSSKDRPQQGQQGMMSSHERSSNVPLPSTREERLLERSSSGNAPTSSSYSSYNIREDHGGVPLPPGNKSSMITRSITVGGENLVKLQLMSERDFQRRYLLGNPVRVFFHVIGKSGKS